METTNRVSQQVTRCVVTVGDDLVVVRVESRMWLRSAPATDRVLLPAVAPPVVDIRIARCIPGVDVQCIQSPKFIVAVILLGGLISLWKSTGGMPDWVVYSLLAGVLVVSAVAGHYVWKAACATWKRNRVRR